jgi:uroporphyrinogen III methyltransferase/synthase
LIGLFSQVLSGLTRFFKRAFEHHKKDARFIAGLKVASVGPETSKALRNYGIAPDLEPKRFEAAAIADEFTASSKDLTRRKILLLRTDIAPPVLEGRLKKLGAEVHPVTVYKTRPPKKISPEIKKAILEGNIDTITFTSSSTVINFVKIMGSAALKKMAKKVKFASIGPVTSETLHEYGLKAAYEAKVSTIEGLMEAIGQMK